MSDNKSEVVEQVEKIRQARVSCGFSQCRERKSVLLTAYDNQKRLRNRSNLAVVIAQEYIAELQEKLGIRLVPEKRLQEIESRILSPARAEGHRSGLLQAARMASAKAGRLYHAAIPGSWADGKDAKCAPLDPIDCQKCELLKLAKRLRDLAKEEK